MPENSPFYHRGPIRRPEHFYNRKREVARCLHLIDKGQSLSISGPRKIGKTSLLFHLMHSEVMAAHGLTAGDYLLVFFDCSGLQELVPRELYAYILEGIDERLESRGVEFKWRLSDDRTAYLDFDRAIKQATRHKRLVLIFDEFEGLSRNHHLDARFFAGLRALAIQHEVVFLTGSKVPLAQLSTARKDSLLSSFFFNIFSNIRLGLFSWDDGRAYIQHALQSTALRFSDQTLTWVLQMSGCHPFFIQIASDCAYVRQAAVARPRLLPEDFEQIKKCIQAEARDHFKYYWDDLTDVERYVLKIISRSSQLGNYSRDIAVLKEQSLVVEKEDGLNYFSPVFREFVFAEPVEGILQSGPFIVDLQHREAYLRDEKLSLTGQNYDLLIYFLERTGQVISREELDREVWQPVDAIGSEERVKAGVRSLRQALGDDKTYIESRWGQGYVFQPDPVIGE